ncbi:golgi reassembly-stacking protein [Myriangium duriaei CBS 260.36]|uniref:Golgi reassembly-stacking protein n=1 Tax=Myriangium duriaei CBS 260.36 TaxID=1168546 RepID=A0A9P4J4M6_9PEZI|nr:golgi reassembly-stacking protein [Myriangium duriaei CBS 260.36]
MFGALNRFISRLDSEQPQKPSGQSAYGFQVLKNLNVELAIEPWFDFIIGINGRSIDNGDPNLFIAEVKNCAGSSISLGVFSAKGQAIREQYVQVPHDSGALGLSLQWTSLATTEDVWHILDVTPNSPADLAGILPYSDYVIGSPEGPMRGENALPELIEAHMNRSIRLYVYNNEYDVTRTVDITPSRAWGGSGALGCVLGFGALHRLPAPLTEPSQAPGETLFEAARFSNEEPRASPAMLQQGFQQHPTAGAPDLMIPVGTGPPKAPAGGPPKAGRKVRAHHNVSPGAAMDDYFKEQEEKSRELDRGSTPKAASSLPPPPKGGPPRSTKSPNPPEVESAEEKTEELPEKEEG